MEYTRHELRCELLCVALSDWSNEVRHHVFDIRPDTEFELRVGGSVNAHDVSFLGLDERQFKTNIGRTDYVS